MSILNTPIMIKGVKLKNRLVMPPMATSNGKDGKILPKFYDYYHEKSLGGYIGLIIVEHCYINIDGKASMNQISISNDEDIEGLKKLVDIIHKNNTPVFAQINHAGSKSVDGKKMSASKVQHPTAKEGESLPEAMSLIEIRRVVEDFSSAALRAKDAGFDGVEIHSAHGYLLNQFYSPLTNLRDDQYGGKLLNRIQIHLEIIKEIRTVVGDDYPIALRLGACDYIEGGSTIDDALTASLAFEQAGVDLLDITGGLKGYIRPNRNEEGYFSDVSSAIKEQLSIPVILTGGVISKKGLENLLDNNYADLIGVGRSIFKDSSWAQNIWE